MCSPLSVKFLLALLMFGAKDNTLEELQSGLNLPADKSSLKSFHETLQKYQKV